MPYIIGSCWKGFKCSKANENITIPLQGSNTSEKYPTICVQFSYAYALLGYNKAIWRYKSKIDEYGFIPNEDVSEVAEIFPYFSYPEYLEQCKQIKFRTLDYTHMLTNMRNHLITHGYDFCPKEHYFEIAHTHPDILSRAIIFDKIDIQNAFIAEKMFSCQVEDFFRENNWNEMAEFVCITRAWHCACNMWGIHTDKRVQCLYEMHNFLTKDIDFDAFPSLFGCYIKGMPIQTYKAILQNISTCIQLYKFAHGGNK